MVIVESIVFVWVVEWVQMKMVEQWSVQTVEAHLQMIGIVVDRQVIEQVIVEGIVQVTEVVGIVAVVVVMVVVAVAVVVVAVVAVDAVAVAVLAAEPLETDKE